MLVITKILLARCQKLKGKFPPVYSPIVGVCTHRTQAGNVVMVSTDLGHMYQLKETYGQAKDYIGNLTVEEVFTKDVIKCSRYELAGAGMSLTWC